MDTTTVEDYRLAGSSIQAHAWVLTLDVSGDKIKVVQMSRNLLDAMGLAEDELPNEAVLQKLAASANDEDLMLRCIQGAVETNTSFTRPYLAPEQWHGSAKQMLQEADPKVAKMKLSASVYSSWTHTTAQVKPYGEERDASSVSCTVSHSSGSSKYLHVTLEEENASKSGGPSDTTQWLQLLRAASVNICMSKTPEELFRVSLSALYAIANVERILVYRFDAEDGHGLVVGELLQPGDGCSYQSMEGLHFPHSDVPLRARAMLMKTPFRSIADTLSQTVPMAPAALGDSKSAAASPELTLCPVRAATGCHTQYLAAMGVRGSIVLPIIFDSTLWGFFSMHSLTKPLFMSHDQRLLCTMIQLLASSCLSKLKERDVLARSLNFERVLLRSAHSLTSITSLLEEIENDLLSQLGCCAILAEYPSFTGRVEVRRVVAEADRSALDALAASVSLTHGLQDTVYLSCLKGAVTDPRLLKWPSGISVAGVAILSCGPCRVVFVREEWVHEVCWAGNSTHLNVQEPRQSFDRWVQLSKGNSRRWSEGDRHAVHLFREHLKIMHQYQRQQKYRLRERELQQSIDAAEQSSDQKSMFLAHMSHELRTPFNGLCGLLNLLHSSRMTADQKEMLSTASYCADHILGVLDSVLLFSKLESSTFELHTAPCSLLELISSACKVIQTRAEQREIELRMTVKTLKGNQHAEAELESPFDISGISIPVHDVIADSGKLRQVVFNLLGNATKFTEPGRSVELELLQADGLSNLVGLVTSTGNSYDSSNVNDEMMAQLLGLTTVASANPHQKYTYVAISVIDEGIGMHEYELPLLFIPFSQLNTGTARAHDGTGLGLVICRELVSHMQGAIMVWSTKGHGSCFRVILPLPITGAVAPAEAPKSPSLSPVVPLLKTSTLNLVRERRKRITSSPVILIVDDNAINRKVLEKMIKRVSDDLVCKTVSGGLEAIQECQALHSSIAVVLMDLHMPGVDGRAATVAIRKQEVQSHLSCLPIIGVTADATEEAHKTCLDAGMQDIMTKPVGFDQVRLLLGEET
ncbi:unnamed protein product [Chrysoparadoxa australica]